MSHGTSNSLRAPATGPRLYCEIDGLEVDVDAGTLTIAGLFVQTIEPIADESEIELFLRSAAGSASVQATVVRVVTCEEATRAQATPGFGVLFLDVTDDARDFLEETVLQIRDHRTLMPQGIAAAAPVPPSPAVPNIGRTPRRRPRSVRTTVRTSCPPAPQVPVAHAAVPQAPPTPAAAPSRGLAPPRTSVRPASPKVESTAKGGPSSTDTAVVRRDLRQTLAQQRKWASWRVLGIDAGATADDAKRAFLRKAKENHPHAHARHGCQEINQLATELFILCKQAYSDFCREASRRTPDGKQDAQRGPRRMPTRSYQQD